MQMLKDIESLRKNVLEYQGSTYHVFLDFMAWVYLQITLEMEMNMRNNEILFANMCLLLKQNARENALKS